MILKPSEVQTFYNRFGTRQDAQRFYEDRALDDLAAHAHFGEAEKVFEFGCGTGRFATRLLEGYLPSSAIYLGCDLSPRMVELATARLARYAGRVRVLQTDGAVHFPVPRNSVDRVIATYVLDLLSDTDIREFLREAYRVLDVKGRLCLVGLTEGTTFLSLAVSAAWSSVFRLRAQLVGGCRPVCLGQYINPGHWDVEYRNVAIAFGVPSEVWVVRPRHFGGKAGSE